MADKRLSEMQLQTICLPKRGYKEDANDVSSCVYGGANGDRGAWFGPCGGSSINKYGGGNCTCSPLLWKDRIRLEHIGIGYGYWLVCLHFKSKDEADSPNSRIGKDST